ncbi:MAG: NAD(P)/FAD-dependent oxidoreductase [Acidobacteriota bacterium]
MPALIVGAGPAGLAVAACLKHEGIDSVILEQERQVASSWRRHYDRLHLHTPRDHSSLPHRRMPTAFPRYPSRDQVIDYFEAYAAHFKLAPRFQQRVTAVRPANGGWEVRTDDGRYEVPHVVIAAGYNREPIVPRWPGQETFGGTVVHSAEYRNGRPFAGKRVLVVGFGNSGGEIAIDLHEHGAEPSIAVRGAVNVVPREILGIPVLALGLLQRVLTPAAADRINGPLLRAIVGDLGRYGLRKLPYGPSTQIRVHGRIPLIDVGTMALIREGHVTVRPGVERFEADGVVFTDGTREPFDAVVLATGFRPRVSFLDAGPGVCDEAGAPLTSGVESAAKGLYFCAYYVSPNGMLRQIAVEAPRIARSIAASR